MFHYLTLGDKTEVMHSAVEKVNGKDAVRVFFERPDKKHFFKSAWFLIPTIECLSNSDFSDDELYVLTQFLERNKHLIFEAALQGAEY